MRIFNQIGTYILVGALSVTAASAQFAQVGQPAPMIAVTNLAGDRVSLSDMQAQGSPIFLFFINTQDNTSGAAAYYINKISAAYSPSKTKWYGIANGPADQVRAYQSQMNPNYQILMDERLVSMRMFDAKASPTVVEIGHDGVVMNIWTGYSASMLKKLNRAVAQANGKRPATMDFSKAPNATEFGHPYIGAQPGSGPGGGG